jgi:uncharacterized protein (DUF433 family)
LQRSHRCAQDNAVRNAHNLENAFAVQPDNALAPREVLFVADISKTRNAKVMRRVVRAACSRRKARPTLPRWKTRARWKTSSAQLSLALNGDLQTAAARQHLGMKFTRITIKPTQMGGVPCIRGLRIPVATVVGMIADGMSNEEIFRAYPDLEAQDIREALRFAAESVRERELPLLASS